MKIAFGILLFIVLIATSSIDAIGDDKGYSHSSFIGGQFLVASENMKDPRFTGSVIYILGHGADGAMGLMINRPIGSGRLGKLMQVFGVNDSDTNDIDTNIRLYYGGPVDPGRGFILHTEDYHGKGTTVVNDEISFTSRLEILKDIAKGNGPKRSLVILGYASWTAGQLESELAHGDWLTAPAEINLLFSDDPQSIWQKAHKISGLAI